jgi:hypothetical protein
LSQTTSQMRFVPIDAHTAAVGSLTNESQMKRGLFVFDAQRLDLNARDMKDLASGITHPLRRSPQPKPLRRPTTLHVRRSLPLILCHLRPQNLAWLHFKATFAFLLCFPISYGDHTEPSGSIKLPRENSDIWPSMQLRVCPRPTSEGPITRLISSSMALYSMGNA